LPGAPVWRNAYVETRFFAYTICENALATKSFPPWAHVRPRNVLFSRAIQFFLEEHDG
jgi:hypothetical protein